MRSVWKFPLVVSDESNIDIRNEIMMPKDSHVLSVESRLPNADDLSIINVYALVDTHANDDGDYETHKFQVVATGKDVEDVEDGLTCKYSEVLEFINTVHLEGIFETKCYHVFEVKTDGQ